MNVSKFNEKLNRVEGKTYTIEEVVTPINGIYEGELIHDNVDLKTLNVYTGSKLTGDKVNSYSTSTPSLASWKTIIKIFSKITPLYISYETIGDQVEAEDVNRLQDSIVITQENINGEIDRATDRENSIEKNLNSEINRAKNDETIITNNLNKEVEKAKIRENIIEKNINDYKISNASEIQGLKSKDIDLDNKKANLEYVNVELNKRYTKEQIFTKEEVLKKIQDIIGTAPDTLDTFKEIADALGNDPNFATTIMSKLSNKVDKVEGKSLSTNDYDNTEKSKLADVNSQKHNHTNKSIIDKITQDIFNSWNSAYTHISDAIKHITSSERNLWNTVTNKAEKEHKHNKSDITSFPTKVSEFENDKGFITRSDIDTSQNHIHTNISSLNKITDEKILNWDETSKSLNSLFEVVNIPSSNANWGFELGKINTSNKKGIVTIRLCGSNDYDSDELTHGLYEIIIKTHSKESTNNMECTAELIVLREPQKTSVNGIKNVYIRKSDNALVIETNGNMIYANYIANIVKDKNDRFVTNIIYLNAPSDLVSNYVNAKNIRISGPLTWNDLKGV